MIASHRRSRRNSVRCFYCPETFGRTQERATHIRHYHPGEPYRPDLEEQKRAALEQPTPAARVEHAKERPTAMVVAKGQLVDVLAPPDPDTMTPKQHLVAAITSIKRNQEAAVRQIPELEKQLEALRAAQKQMETELCALETALAAMNGGNQA
jgi:hypothetical protein